MKADYANVDHLVCRLLLSMVTKDERRTAEGPTETQHKEHIAIALACFDHVSSYEEAESR